MNLVCFIGIDGTGKTTLARSTVAALQERGRPAAYIYGRTCPATSRLLMVLGRLAFFRKHDPWLDYKAYASSKRRVSRHEFLSWPYTVAIWLDYSVQIWLKLLPHLLSRRVVVSDRYVYDTVINELAVQLGYSPVQTQRAIGRGLQILPKPALTILLDLPEEVAFQRKADVPHIDYLKERRSRYLELGARPEVELLDGEASPSDLLNHVLQRIALQGNGDRAQ
jgi:thymidylate kinase